MPPLVIHALVLAAGESKRFNGIKQLAPLLNWPRKIEKNCIDKAADSRPIIQHVAEQLAMSGFQAYTVLLGANATSIIPFLNEDSRYIVLKNWQQGMGASIAEGILKLPSNVTHVCITLADQVALSYEHFNLLIAEAKSNPEHIIAASFQHRLGAPCIFPRQYFSKLAILSADIGARYILKDENNKLKTVHIPEASIDVDTVDDLHLVNTQAPQN